MRAAGATPEREQATQMRPRFLMQLAISALLAGIVLAGCGGGDAPAQAAAPAPPPPAPQITSVAPTTITPPARIVVNGTGLDAVAQARLGSATLAIAAQSPATLALDVPAGAATGFLALVDRQGTLRVSAQQITVLTDVVLSSLAPASVLSGGALTITGRGLDRVISVEFAGGASATPTSRSGSTSIVVSVPAAALSGPVIAITGNGERVASAASLTVVPRIVVTNAGSFAVAAGGSVTLAGSGLTEVTSVTVGTLAAVISARSATELRLAVPAGIACGAITLLSASQPPVAAGSVAVDGGCSLRLESIEFAQLLSQPSADTRQRLVPRRETWVRAYVVSTQTGQPAPVVRLSAFNGTTLLGTRPMIGPSPLPVLAAGSILPDSLRYSGALSFNAQLDDAWVEPGLRVQVAVDPDGVFGAPVVATSVPAVGSGTRIDLVLVPLVSGSNVPTVSSTAVAQVVDELTRRLPVPRSSISVSLRSPYTLTSVSDGVDQSSEWSSALAELERLRDLEAPNRHYYGLVRPMVSAGIAGIGYVNPVGSSLPALASIGWDTSRSNWLRTMIHELGHNFGRLHAPCGAVANADPGYPYANGALGPTPLFEALLDAVVSPLGLSDVMGYCGGQWFSDYNLREVQRFLEARPQTASEVVTSAAASEEGRVLVVSGVIGLTGVRLAPLQAARGRAGVAPPGEYLLRLRTAAGGSFEVPFDAVTVDHALPPERHFLVRVPDPGELASVEVLRADRVIATRLSEVATDRVRAAAVAPAVTSVESDGVVTLSWDAARYPFVSVVHVAAAGRRVLAIDAQAGTLRFGSAELIGGLFEVSLSDGLNTRLEVIAR